jgi:HD-like signal output (HDOD) protein/CheY-like chemotaxis protein
VPSSSSSSSSAGAAGASVLVVDDQALVREPIAALLRSKGYRTAEAGDAETALASLKARPADLVLLDLEMPGMGGLGFLRALRAGAATAGTRVLLLSAVRDRETVAEVARLGIDGYLLKTSFTTEGLMRAVAGALARPAAGGGGVTQTSGPQAAATGVGMSGVSPAPPVPPAQVTLPPAAGIGCRGSATPVARLLTREQSAARAEEAVHAKALSGVVLQVLAQAGSPRGDLAEMATLISRDPMLSARVLQIANGASYASARGMVATIPDAVRKIGLAAVRNAAAAVGVMDAVAGATGVAWPDGFDPIRCWQHSFAVARLCETLVEADAPDLGGIAYLVGLCHDLGELCFRAKFAEEYRLLLEAHRETAVPVEHLEREMLGVTRAQMLLKLLRALGLPETIARPIEEFHRGTSAGAGETQVLCRALRVADAYANGLLLAPHDEACVTSLRPDECRSGAGTVAASASQPVRPDAAAFRGEIVSLTGILARLGADEEAALLRPRYQPGPARIWLARDAAYAAFCPLEAALTSMASAVTVSTGLPPDVDAWQHVDALVVAARSGSVAGLGHDDIVRAARSRPAGFPPVVWLAGRPAASPAGATLRSHSPAISIRELHEFVRGAGSGA